ncbi:hypothetical protein [Persicirhabdus sediminis]|uniref:HlyD family secretion protein n=1 Tax=Persicirhabdus sediminis TaxID=454144 RepID=A0A8J7MB23_9BACT|nr:hypothetical protein [Persicirhabdus sediminis]MBK1789758.1 hypothetical protein [Persicirhabdus sediminis]
MKAYIKFIALILLSTLLTDVSLGATPKLSQYTISNKIWITSSEAILKPKSFREYSLYGEITILCKDGAELQKGEVWAIVDKKRLELEQESLELARAELETLNTESKWEVIDSRKQLAEGLSELLVKKQELEVILKDSRLTSAELKASIQEAVNQIDKQIDIFNTKINPQNLERKRNQKLAEARISFQKRELEFEKLKRTNNIKAPFDGRIKFNSSQIAEKWDQASSEQKEIEIWLESNETIAEIVDDSNFSIHLISDLPILGASDLTDFISTLNQGAPEGMIRGKFSHTETDVNANRRQQIHIFNVIEADIKKAKDAVNGEFLANVHRNLRQNCYIVRKQDIISLAPDVLDQQGWQGLVKHLWPESTLVQNGAQLLAVSRPDSDDE